MYSHVIAWYIYIYIYIWDLYINILLVEWYILGDVKLKHPPWIIEAQGPAPPWIEEAQGWSLQWTYLDCYIYYYY